jgi:hypothetical protein
MIYFERQVFNNEVSRYFTIIKILFSSYDVKQIHHTRGILSNVAYSRYDVTSEMFLIDNDRSVCHLLPASFFLYLFFYFENGGSVVLRNVGDF